ncbi:MAG: hypothetical protein GQ574_00495 [Crocinitomix sp.]|nr:hypothetical protein [Crocinitomix sp.]
MKLNTKHIKPLIGVVLLGIIGYVLYFALFFNPFDFGPCDGNGEPNRYKKVYYDNGRIELEGQLKNCVWHGLIKTHFETGALKSQEQRIEGRNHGISTFYYPNGKTYREEEYHKGELIRFKIFSPNSSLHYEYLKSDRLLSVMDSANHSQIIFTDSLLLSGNDKPFIVLKGDNLILKAKKDYYLINSNLEIKIDLRDTLMKYIPSAYIKKVDFSGNIHDFLWHRRIENDSLSVKVFYDGDESQSMQKTWERKYKLE